MPLQQLAESFNDRFEDEHKSNLRPFLLNSGRISGLFGPIQVSSVFAPVRSVGKLEVVIGHIARLSVSPSDVQSLYDHRQAAWADFQSVINLDRLTRTVHMLNFLPLSHRSKLLFLEVDPRHILGVASNHGAYFEEVIERCGLTTQDIVISTAVMPFFSQHQERQRLLQGLGNYRQRGYKIALDVGYSYAANDLPDLITHLTPDYLRINAPGSGLVDLSVQIAWPYFLEALKDLAGMIGSQIILQQADKPEQAVVAERLDFKLVQGRYYDQLVSDDYRSA